MSWLLLKSITTITWVLGTSLSLSQLSHIPCLTLRLSFNIVLTLATQFTGFGLAGICRRFLVWPASLIWPLNLVVCTLLNTLHAEDESMGVGGITRYRFFMIASFGSFFWYFLPGYLFQALSAFSFVCWFKPSESHTWHIPLSFTNIPFKIMLWSTNYLERVLGLECRFSHLTGLRSPTLARH